MTLPLVKVISTRKTPAITQWWIDWDGTQLGPFAAERDACRRAADMVSIAWAYERDAPRVQPWPEMAQWLGVGKDPADLTRLVGACRAAHDALLLSLASQPWSDQAVCDALMHAGQWLAPVIGATQDVVSFGMVVRLTVENSTIELVCDLTNRTINLRTRKP